MTLNLDPELLPTLKLVGEIPTTSFSCVHSFSTIAHSVVGLALAVGATGKGGTTLAC